MEIGQVASCLRFCWQIHIFRGYIYLYLKYHAVSHLYPSWTHRPMEMFAFWESTLAESTNQWMS